MGTSAGRKESESDLALFDKIFWQERPEKFRVNHYRIEEVKTPYDLFVEGTYNRNSVGNVFHQMMVKNKLERIFSIRTASGFPMGDIITMPADGRILSPAWCIQRELKTSFPMTVDGQKLVVLAVIKEDDKVVDEPLMNCTKEFFLGKGGELKDEHPNRLALNSTKAVKEWRQIVDNHKLIDLHVGSHLISPPKDYWTHGIHTINLGEAITLLRVRYWKDVYVNGDEDWAKDVVSHIKTYPPDKPVGKLSVLGDSEKAKKLAEEVANLIIT